MKKCVYFLSCLLLIAGGLVYGQSPDAVPAQGTIEIAVKGIPSEDEASISGQYLLDADGTIRLPQLPHGQDVLRVVGKTARQIENMLTVAYRKAELYTAPTFLVKMQKEGKVQKEELTQHIVMVGGEVASNGNMPWRHGMTLCEAIIAAGDVLDFASRYIQLTRDGKTTKYDYFSVKDRAIPLLPNDRVFVPLRAPIEARPAMLLVSGKVAASGNVPWRHGMTLLEAIVAAGDITDWGSRYIRVTRDGKITKYDYFSVRDRATLMLPNDQVHVPPRSVDGTWPSTLVP